MRRTEIKMEELELVTGGCDSSDSSSSILNNSFINNSVRIGKWAMTLIELMLSGDEDAGCL